MAPSGHAASVVDAPQQAFVRAEPSLLADRVGKFDERCGDP
jgi:hypothetical protein